MVKLTTEQYDAIGYICETLSLVRLKSLLNHRLDIHPRPWEEDGLSSQDIQKVYQPLFDSLKAISEFTDCEDILDLATNTLFLDEEEDLLIEHLLSNRYTPNQKCGIVLALSTKKLCRNPKNHTETLCSLYVHTSESGNDINLKQYLANTLSTLVMEETLEVITPALLNPENGVSRLLILDGYRRCRSLPKVKELRSEFANDSLLNLALPFLAFTDEEMWQF